MHSTAAAAADARLTAAALPLPPPSSGDGEKDATGRNACGFGGLSSKWERYYCALPSSMYDRGDCGQCAKVCGARGCVTVKVRTPSGGAACYSGGTASAPTESPAAPPCVLMDPPAHPPLACQVVDECASCSYGDIDLSTAALKKATGYSWDRKGVTWSITSCGGDDEGSYEEERPRRRRNKGRKGKKQRKSRYD